MFELLRVLLLSPEQKPDSHIDGWSQQRGNADNVPDSSPKLPKCTPSSVF